MKLDSNICQHLFMQILWYIVIQAYAVECNTVTKYSEQYYD